MSQNEPWKEGGEMSDKKSNERSCSFCMRKFNKNYLLIHNKTSRALCIDCITGTNRDLIAMMAKALAGVGSHDPLMGTTLE